MDIRSYNPELYDFLAQSYGGSENITLVTDSQTGKTGYLTQNGLYNWSITPTNIDSVDTVLNAIPGMGSGETSSAPGAKSYTTYINHIKEGHVPDYAVVGSGYMWDDDYQGNGNALMNTIEFVNNNGSKVTDVGIVPFSWSGKTSMMNAGKVLAAYPDTNVRVATLDVSLMDSFIQYANKNEQSGAYASEISALLSNQDKIELTMLIPDGKNWGNVSYAYGKESNEIIQLQNKGFDTVMVLSSNNNHADIREIAIKGGNIFDYAAGKISLKEFLESAEAFYVTDESVLDSRKTRNFLYTQKIINNSSDFLKLTTINDNVSLQGEKIGSDYEYVAKAMNAIRTQIKSNNYGTRSVQIFSDVSGIPGCISGYINTYYNMIAQLMTQIEEQTASILTTAQKYVDLDNGLERISYDFLFETTQKESDKSEEIPTSTEPDSKPSDKPKEDSSPDDTPKTHNTIPGSWQPASQNSQPTDSTPTEKGAEYAVLAENDDNSRILLDVTDTSEPLIVYEIPLSETADSEAVLKNYEDIYKDLLYFKKITIEDNKVKIMFDANYFKGMSNDEIVATIMNGGKKDENLI